MTVENTIFFFTFMSIIIATQPWKFC